MEKGAEEWEWEEEDNVRHLPSFPQSFRWIKVDPPKNCQLLMEIPFVPLNPQILKIWGRFHLYLRSVPKNKLPNTTVGTRCAASKRGSRQANRDQFNIRLCDIQIFLPSRYAIQYGKSITIHESIHDTKR